MDNPRINETTREKIEEAAVSVFMDQYAKALDAGIDQQIEACADSEFPPELEKRCRALIEKEYAKARSEKRRKTALRTLRSAAAVVVAALGLCSVLFVTVEAFRVPVMNFFIEKTDYYWEMISGENEEMPTDLNKSDPLEGILTEGFHLLGTTGSWEEGNLISDYGNGADKTVSLYVVSSGGINQTDTEDSSAIQFKLSGHDAILSVEESVVRVTWLDSSKEKVFTIISVNMLVEETLDIAGKLDEKIK